MFDELDAPVGEDSLITCLNNVFDSDSYQEMISKLNCLKEASSLYEKGDRVEAFKCISHLDSEKHKKVYSGECVTYSNNALNQVEKPKSLFRREKELYTRIDPSISYSFMEELHYGLEVLMK